jgi:hypothetical protein
MPQYIRYPADPSAPASATDPGDVTTGTQTFAGDKTFNGNLTTGGYIIAGNGAFANTLGAATANTTLGLSGQKADSAAAVAVSIGSIFNYTTPGAKLLSVQNNTVEKFAIDLSGKTVQGYTDTSGTPGAATANTPTGRSALAAVSGVAGIVITNSCVKTTSVVLAILEDLDTTGVTWKIVPANGSFTFFTGANTTAIMKFSLGCF